MSKLKPRVVVIGAIIAIVLVAGGFYVRLSRQDQNLSIAKAQDHYYKNEYVEVIAQLSPLDLQSLNYQTMKILADSYRRLDKQEDFRKVNELMTQRFAENTEDLVRQGNLALSNNDQVLAKEKFHRALELDRNNFTAYLGLANVEKIDGNYEEAIVQLEPGLAYSSIKIDLLIEIAQLAELAKDHEEARSAYGQVLAIDPNHLIAKSKVGE